MPHTEAACHRIKKNIKMMALFFSVCFSARFIPRIVTTRPGPTFPVHCVLSWSEWSPCTSASGTRWRVADIVTHNRNGGRECSDLVEKQMCNNNSAKLVRCCSGCQRCNGDTAMDACVECQAGFDLKFGGFCIQSSKI